MDLTDKNNRAVLIPYSGTALLEMSLLNKGSAFSKEERTQLKLHGLVPQTIETIEEQAKRVYSQYRLLKVDIEKHIYLRDLQDTNETLFYHLVCNHLEEMMPNIYTPVVGEACERFSDIYRASRGLFISYPHKDRIDEMLQNVTKQKVKVIVVTDGERILGLGDQGIGGMGIPIGKLSLYTACGGISPAYTLPLVLDVGTNNQQLIDDPLYMGWRNPRITGVEYEEFLDAFIKAVKRRWPDVLLQFEDFAQKNALPLLKRYQNEICCFNDDIQGTAAAVLGCLMAASKAAHGKISDQRVVFLGAGSAGCGIAEQIIAQMKREGLSENEARSKVYMVDRFGLLTDKMPNLLEFQNALAQRSENLSQWPIESDAISLLETVQNARPTILIGVSAQSGLFTEEIIRAMAAHCERPIIFPLSNPNSKVEALPEDIIRWTEGKALVATGSPFVPVKFNDKIYSIVQCNNSYIFPGIGLGVLSSKARRITDGMLMAASSALAELSPMALNPQGSLLPELKNIEKVSRTIAFKVAKAAQEDDVAARQSDEELLASIDNNYWYPRYRKYNLAPN